MRSYSVLSSVARNSNLLLIVGFGLGSFFISGINAPFKSEALRLIGVSGLLLVALYRIFIIKKTRIPVAFFALFLFIIAYGFRLYNDSVILGLEFGFPPKILWAKFVGLVIFPFILIAISGRLEVNIKLLIFSLSLISGLSLINGFVFGYSYRLNGNSVLNPISVGTYAGMLLCLLMFKIPSWRKLINNLSWFASFACGLAALVLSLSRGPMLATIIVCCLIFWQTAKLSKGSKLLLVSVIGGASIFYLLELLQNLSAGSRMFVNFGEDGEGTAEARVVLWAMAFTRIAAQPILGSSTTTELGYVHNVFLEALMATGLIGLFCFCIPVILHCRSAIIYGLSQNSHSSSISALFIFNVICSVFSGTVYNAEFLWVFLGLFMREKLFFRGEEV